MKFNKLSIKDLPLQGKRVFIRVDFNVPLDNQLNVTDGTRITRSLPTIEFAVKGGAKVILASHLGRPKGKVHEKMSLKPVRAVLSNLLGKEILIAPDCVGAETRKLVNSMEDGDIVLLENLRFHKAETENDEDFAKELALLADFYVNDAFGAAHRAHASVSAITRFVDKSVSGFLMDKEIEFLGNKIEFPEKPFVTVMGGAKIDTKIDAIYFLMEKCDSILIGGGMAYTFLRAKGYAVGDSLVDSKKLEVAGEILKRAESAGCEIILPVDTVIAKEMKEFAEHKTVAVDMIPDGWKGLDIGLETVTNFKGILQSAGTVLWNGPMGVFEMKPFNVGTEELARAVRYLKAITIAGGGDTAAALQMAGCAGAFTHISTGGGASLELISGKPMPGIECLTEKTNLTGE